MRRICTSILVVLASWVFSGPAAGRTGNGYNDADPLIASLESSGLDAGRLGFRPKGYWLRYPDPRIIPYKNRLFDDLMSEPGEIYPTVRLLAGAAERFLTPSYSDTASDALFQLAFYTGWDLATSGFRPYNAALNDRPEPDEPLVEAVGRLWADAGRGFDVWSNEQPSDWPGPCEEVRKAVAHLDPDLRRILAQAVLDLADARRWHELAFRRVDAKLVTRLWNVRDLPATQPDGSEYYPEIDDVAADLDAQALVASSRKTVFAAGRLAVSLRRWIEGGPPGLAGQSLSLRTPAGRIVVGGSGKDVYEGGEVFLSVDLGGDDEYRGAVGASSSPTLPVAAAVDMAGNDTYTSDDPMELTQGSGFFGSGVLVDVSGDDAYTAGRCSQGYGFFGTGLLADMGGRDAYRLATGGQGGGVFGVGLLFDRGGDDAYTLDGDGQGYGGPGGIGTLVDLSGNDRYYAEPYAEKVARPDYHSQGIINSSNAQGSGMGRRGDLTDGHSYAGGMGTLLDLGGDDVYESGNWSAGCGYWYGMGFLYDAGGDDLYSASVFSLAAGAHFCIAGLFDEGGDDRYVGLGDSHTGLGFGHDYTVAVLFDRTGDDLYDYGSDGFGHAINMSQVFFVDGGGKDRYILGKGRNGFGVTDRNPSNPSPPLELNYHVHSTEIGMFLDLGGQDDYLTRDEGGNVAPADSLTNGLQWLRPPDAVRDGDGRYAGIFRDLEAAGSPAWFEERRRAE